MISALWQIAQHPRPGEVYNLGGGRENSASLRECVDLIAECSGRRPKLTYSEQNRIGDHICYYSDLRKMRAHYPQWDITQSLEETIRQIVEAWQARQVTA